MARHPKGIVGTPLTREIKLGPLPTKKDMKDLFAAAERSSVLGGAKPVCRKKGKAKRG